tara:strand:+ start:414 stop:977 length:564 start_codon:yes stop_codon:yes gene_type:complete
MTNNNNDRNLRRRISYTERYSLLSSETPSISISITTIPVSQGLIYNTITPSSGFISQILNSNLSTPNSTYMMYNNLSFNNNFNNSINQLQNYRNFTEEILFPPVGILQYIINNLLEKNNKQTLTEEEYKNLISEKNEKLDECPICYAESEKYIKINKCEHKFCENCIKKWLLDNAITCPLCRTNLLD